jgi:hypothetical protein
MRLLHNQLGVSYDELMEVDPVPKRRPGASGEESEA